MISEKTREYVDRVRAIAPLIEEHAERSERAGQIAPEVVEGLHQSGVFRILLPPRLDGGGLTIPETFGIFEETARIDGSVGWTTSICSGGPLFGNFVSQSAYEEIFREPRAVIAGSLNPMTTRVEPVDGGYRFSGRATFVSGSAIATWIMVAGLVLKDGGPQFVDGIPVVRAALFPMRHCTILDTWQVSGMCATGSNDCVFENVFVPADFTYDWPDPESSWQRGAFATLPLPTQLGGVLAAVAVGVAQHAIDAFIDLAVTKVPTATRATLRERPLAQIQFAQAEGLLRAARTYLYAMVDEVWSAGERGERFDPVARANARLASVTAARLAAQSVDLIHDAAGATSIARSCAIERCWRDAHAITQHVILSTGRFEIVGRVLLGLPAGMPII